VGAIVVVEIARLKKRANGFAAARLPITYALKRRADEPHALPPGTLRTTMTGDNRWLADPLVLFGHRVNNRLL